jgi:hypothetical protein
VALAATTSLADTPASASGRHVRPATNDGIDLPDIVNMWSDAASLICDVTTLPPPPATPTIPADKLYQGPVAIDCRRPLEDQSATTCTASFADESGAPLTPPFMALSGAFAASFYDAFLVPESTRDAVSYKSFADPYASVLCHSSGLFYVYSSEGRRD